MRGGVPPAPRVDCRRHQRFCILLQRCALLRYDVAPQRCVDILGLRLQMYIHFFNPANL